MDGTEPYTGYDDYDPGMSDSTMPKDVYGTDGSLPSSTVEEPEPQSEATSSFIDPRRDRELNLLGEGFVLPVKYSEPGRGYGDVPVVQPFTDSRRLAIHPLVIVSAPPGVDD